MKRVILILAVLLGLTTSAHAQVVLETGPGSGGAPFIDSSVLVYGSSDATKGLKFEVDTNLDPSETVTLTVPAASGPIAVTNAAQDFTAQQTFSSSIVLGRQYASGFTPTCAISSGSNLSAAIEAGSTDMAGVCVITTGTSPSNPAAATITFSTGSAYGSAGAICMATLLQGATAWGAGAAVTATAMTTTTAVFAWDNFDSNGAKTALTNSTTYKLAYICIGRP